MKTNRYLSVLFVVALLIILSLSLSQAQEATATSCGVVNSSLTITQDLVGNTTCFTVNASHIVIDGNGFQIIGNGSAGGLGFNITHQVNVTVKNFNLVRNYSVSPIMLRYVNASIFTNNSFNNSNVGQTQALGVNFSHYNNFTKNNFTSGITAIHMWNSTGNVLFANNVTSEGSRCMRIKESHNTTIHFNVFSCSTQAFFLLSPSSDLIIDNNHMTAGGDVIAVDDSENITITSNNLTSTTTNDAGIDLARVTNATITHNVININNTGTGIVLANSFNVTISNNNITSRGAGGNSINIAGSSPRGNINLTANNITGLHSTTEAIDWENVSGGEIGFNSIYTTGAGMVLDFTGGVIVTNNFINTSGANHYGIHLRNSANNSIIESNTINTTGSGSHTIYLDNVENITVISNSGTSNSTGNGIDVEQSNQTNVTSNYFYSNSGSAIELQQSYDAYVARNTLTGTNASATGILVEQAISTNITANTFMTLLQGVLLGTSAGLTANNSFSENLYLDARYGLEVANGATSFYNNTFKNELVNGSRLDYRIRGTDTDAQIRFINTSFDNVINRTIFFEDASNQFVMRDNQTSNLTLITTPSLGGLNLSRTITLWDNFNVTVRETYANATTVNYTLLTTNYTGQNGFNLTINGVYNDTLVVDSKGTVSKSLYIDTNNSTVSFIYLADGKSPNVTVNSPSNTSLTAGTTSVFLNLTTDENSTCKFNQTDLTFGEMTHFTNSSVNNQTHNSTITGLSAGSHQYFVKCRDAVGNIGSDSIAFTISSASSSSSGGSSSGSGGSSGGGSSNTTSETKFVVTIGSADPDNPAEFTIKGRDDVDITDVSIEVNEEVSNFRVTVESFNTENPGISTPEGLVYDYFQMTVDDFGNEKIDSVTITFTVSEDWMNDNGVTVDDVVLQRLNDDTGQWEQWEATSLGLSDGLYTFQATGPGLSYFAITGMVDVIEEIIEEITEEETIEEEPEVTSKTKKKSKKGLIVLIVLIGLVAVGVGAYFLTRPPKKKK